MILSVSIAIVTLAVIVLVQLAVNIALVNRLLAKCAVPPMELPKRSTPVEPKEDERRRIASIPFRVS